MKLRFVLHRDLVACAEQLADDDTTFVLHKTPYGADKYIRITGEIKPHTRKYLDRMAQAGYVTIR